MDETQVELRGNCPREVVDVLDGWSQAKGLTRTAMVNLILHDWAVKTLREHSVFARVVRGNPLLSDAVPKSAE